MSTATRIKTVVQCNNCDWNGNEDDFVDICCDNPIPEGKGLHLSSVEDLNERLDPGSEVPFGECPECQCFCYIVKPRT